VLLDGDGSNSSIGLHGLAFEADGFGDPNTLYLTSQLNDENDGLLAAITAGFLSAISIRSDVAADTSVTIKATVVSGPTNQALPSEP
jgi:hypothetical protein